MWLQPPWRRFFELLGILDAAHTAGIGSETVCKSGYNKKIKQLLKVAGLHRQGSGAVTHYTMLELADRFKLMNLAFDQEDYRVDKNLEVIPMPKKKDS